MASITSLPPDQRAVLELVLQRGRTYDEIAKLVAVDRAAVRERALAAFDAIGPQTSVPPEQRALITDYLLGQLPPRVCEQVRERLTESSSERAWARILASELAPMSAGPLPEIPPVAVPDVQPAPPSKPKRERTATRDRPPKPKRERKFRFGRARVAEPKAPGAAAFDVASTVSAAQAPEAPPTPAASAPPKPKREPKPKRQPKPKREPRSKRERKPKRERQPGARPISRRGGAVLLVLGAVIVFVLVIVLLASGGSKPKPSATTNAAQSTPTTTSTTQAATATTPSTGATSSTTTTTAPTHVVAQVNLNPPKGAGGAKGVAQVLQQGASSGIVIVASGIPPNTQHNAYAVWLYNAPGDSRILGFVNPGVGSNGRLQTEGVLPTDANKFKTLLVTLETQAKPKIPGKIVLEGPLTLR